MEKATASFRRASLGVIPEQAGIQRFYRLKNTLDSCFRRNDILGLLNDILGLLNDIFGLLFGLQLNPGDDRQIGAKRRRQKAVKSQVFDRHHIQGGVLCLKTHLTKQ